MAKGNSQKNARLGTLFRGKLASLYQKRGHQKADLWYAYSSHSNSDWVLKGYSAYLHFLLMESESRVQSISYAPDPIKITLGNNSSKGFELAATLVTKDGLTEWHIVNTAENLSEKKSDIQRKLQECAEESGACLVVWSPRELISKPQLLANWVDVNAWLAAVRERSLSPYQMNIANLLAVQRTVLLGDIHDMGGSEQFPLYAAATFRQLQQGVYVSDLDTAPLSFDTRISLTSESNT